MQRRDFLVGEWLKTGVARLRKQCRAKAGRQIRRPRLTVGHMCKSIGEASMGCKPKPSKFSQVFLQAVDLVLCSPALPQYQCGCIACRIGLGPED